MLLSMKHLNVTADIKLEPHFVGPFSIVKWIATSDYQLNLGTCYSKVYLILYFSLLRPFHAGKDGYLHPTAMYIAD